MTGQAALERGYRRLLAWYPRGFHAEHGDEMLAVLMAGAADGQQRPGLLETMDVLKSALGMRLRSARDLLRNRDWADALAVFSMLAPLFVLAVTAAQVVLMRDHVVLLSQSAQSAQAEVIGGTDLLHLPIFGIAAGGQVAVAALALLGLRRVTLIVLLASAGGCLGYLIAAHGALSWVPVPLQLITAGTYLLEAAALAASPGPRHGRRLVHWGHGAILLAAAAAVQVSTSVWDTHSPVFAPRAHPGQWVSIVGSALLLAAVPAVALLLRVGWRFVLLAAAACYPYAMQLLWGSLIGHLDLLGNPLPSHLVLLFLPTVLVACVALVSPAVRPADPAPPGPEQPRVPA